MTVSAEGYIDTTITNFTTAEVTTTITNTQSVWQPDEGTPSYSTQYDGTMQITLPITNWNETTKGKVKAVLSNWNGDIITKQAVELTQDETTAAKTSSTNFQFEITAQTFDTDTKSLIITIDSVNKAEINNYEEVYFSVERVYENVYDKDTMPDTETMSSWFIPEVKYWQNAATTSIGLANLTKAEAKDQALYLTFTPMATPTETTSPTYKAWSSAASLATISSSAITQSPELSGASWVELSADGVFGGTDALLIAYAYDGDGNQMNWTVGATAKITSTVLVKTQESFSGYTAKGRWTKGTVSIMARQGQTTII
jgi:hypothetical protein